MTRFWITLEQGVELVFKALEESYGGETYISKIPSFRITDLAEAMLSGAKVKEIGIREGEKLHEVMITKDDSMRTYEYEKHYIIQPHFDWWKFDEGKVGNGVKVTEGFEYNSETNKEWLSVVDLKNELEKLRL